MVLRPKPRNRRSDFEAQITKSKLPVLRPKLGNPPPPWFWGSTKKPTVGFEAKPGETGTTSFEAKLEKTVVADFEAKPLETIATDFEAKPAKTIRVVLRPNHSQIVWVNRRGDFEAQITKLKLPVLRPKLGNPPPPWFWGSTKKPTVDFEAKLGETGTTSFEAKLEKPVVAGFEVKPLETIATDFEAKPEKTIRVVLRPNHSQIVWVVLRPNHSQTIDLGFKAQPRNPYTSSPRARCRPHTAPSDLSIAQPPGTRPVRPSPVLCTRSPTPATILIVACHATPTTCTPREKQTRFSKRNKDKRKIKSNYPGFEFKPRQVNDSS
jgi:hypothetical protein